MASSHELAHEGRMALHMLSSAGIDASCVAPSEALAFISKGVTSATADARGPDRGDPDAVVREGMAMQMLASAGIDLTDVQPRDALAHITNLSTVAAASVHG